MSTWQPTYEALAQFSATQLARADAAEVERDDLARQLHEARADLARYGTLWNETYGRNHS